MKRNFILTLLLAYLSCAVSAQYKMVVAEKDGTITSFEVSNITSVYWTKSHTESHEYIDLGLPSGTKWASCNLGSELPHEYGYFFAWGETVPNKRTYNFSSYALQSGFNKFTKYTTNDLYSADNKKDNKTELEAEDDAAFILWGENFKTPTSSDFQELLDNCTSSVTTVNGVVGVLFTSNITGYTDKSIFLPYAGYQINEYKNEIGQSSNYWTSSLCKDDPSSAYVLTSYNSSSSSVLLTQSSRYIGYSIRPVYFENTEILPSYITVSSNHENLSIGNGIALRVNFYPSNVTDKSITWSSSDSSRATVDSCGNVVAISPGTAVITAKSKGGFKSASCIVEINSNFSSVDLGLSVKWANMNVGAQHIEDFGGYFSWGETKPKTLFGNGYTYKFGKVYYIGDNWYYGYTKYCTIPSYGYEGFTDDKTTLDSEDDAAYVNYGAPWRMPTRQEQDELLNPDNCDWIPFTINDINGYKVISKKPGYNGRWIFLPASGQRSGEALNTPNGIGYYYSSSLYKNNPSEAYAIIVNCLDNRYYWSAIQRNLGFSIRAVYPLK